MPKLTCDGIKFEKIPQRKPINNVNKAITSDSTVYDNIDRFFDKNSRFKKVPVKVFEKDTQRGYGDPFAATPSFMENIYDRNSVNMLMAKTLEMNHFSEG